jgi:nicotinamide mononucleotide transporter
LGHVEIIAAIFGFLAVLLTIFRSPWCWPIGLVQVVLYIGVFYQAKLYSDMLLHVVYVGLQVIGWVQWVRSPLDISRSTERVQVESLSAKGYAVAIVASAFLSLAIGIAMSQFTDAAWPFGDAFIAGTSLVAQWLLVKKKLQNWHLWIVIDVVSIVIFASKGLVPTTCLYIMFLGMAICGAIVWHRQYKELKLA